jgi:TrmH family RNA methyltransferase
MKLCTILVEPKYAGNIGAVARSLMNFGLQDLILVNPACDIEAEECRKMAVHAQQIIDNATILRTFEEAVQKVDYLAGTSATVSQRNNKHLRGALSVHRFAKNIYTLEGVIGLAFGREDYGLLNQEIRQCDVLVNIPTADIYPSLNLSHAASIVLYELWMQRREVAEPRYADRLEKENLYRNFELLLDSICYPVHKKEKTKIMFQRIIGRAMLSKWEYHTLMGVLKGARTK